MDSSYLTVGLYDEEKPFIHMQAIPTFEFLKGQVETPDILKSADP